MEWKGKKVKMVDCAESRIYKNKIWTVRSEPWYIGKDLVVSLEGKTGGFALDKLEVVDD